jgi:hypothetical protein
MYVNLWGGCNSHVAKEMQAATAEFGIESQNSAIRMCVYSAGACAFRGGAQSQAGTGRVLRWAVWEENDYGASSRLDTTELAQGGCIGRDPCTNGAGSLAP